MSDPIDSVFLLEVVDGVRIGCGPVRTCFDLLVFGKLYRAPLAFNFTLEINNGKNIRNHINSNTSFIFFEYGCCLWYGR
jgi:hypothetical protein